MKTIHVSLYDCMAVLPLSGIPNPLGVAPFRRWLGIDPSDFDFTYARHAWLRVRRACNGREVKRHNKRDTFSGLDDPTCPECLALWHTVLVFRDSRMEAA